jgi:hypothetical protein
MTLVFLSSTIALIPALSCEDVDQTDAWRVVSNAFGFGPGDPRADCGGLALAWSYMTGTGRAVHAVPRAVVNPHVIRTAGETADSALLDPCWVRLSAHAQMSWLCGPGTEFSLVASRGWLR